MNKTSIEWVKNPDGIQGYTWNPITGCNNQVDGMCRGGNFPCYAYRLANGRLRDRYIANKNTAPRFYGEQFVEDVLVMNDPFYPRFWPKRIDELDISKQKYCQFREGHGVFVCDMGELFGDWVPREWQEEVFRIIKMNWHHRFYLLTKQPQNLTKWSPFPDNCWVGVTATDHLMFAHGHILLKDIKARVNYISLEPLLNWDRRITAALIRQAAQSGVSWLIIGAQTKPLKPPIIEQIREITEAAAHEGIPVFLKNNLKPLWGDDLFYPEWAMNKDNFALRQEMPEEEDESN